MEYVVGVTIFIFGIIIGSFLNVCIYRIPKGESIAFPPSHCGSCGHNLKVWDLVPIFSWLFLKGRCRYCGEKVSKQYPLIEGATGLLFVFLYLKFGFTIELLKYMIFASILIVIGIIDFKTQDVYDSTIFFLGISGVVFTIIEFFMDKQVSFVSIILGIAIPTLIIGIFAWFGAMGWGDVEIIGVVGLFLGFKLNMLNLFISIVLGGIAAVVLMIWKRRGGKDTMAFGPYIALSSYITLLFGSEILQWYLSFIR